LQLRRHSVENEEDVGEQLSVFSSWLTPRFKKVGGENAGKTENGESRSTVTRRSFLPGDKGIRFSEFPVRWSCRSVRVDQGQRIGSSILDVGVVVNQGVVCW